MPGGAGGTSILAHGREVPQWWPDDPCFWDFQSDWVPFSASSNPSNKQARSDWPVIVLIFNPIDPLFPNFQSNWPPFFEPCQIRLGPFFKLVLSLPTKDFAEYPPPPPPPGHSYPISNWFAAPCRQDKMTEPQIICIKIEGFQPLTQVLTLSGKCQNCRKHNVDYVLNEFHGGQNDWMSLTAHFPKCLTCLRF